MLNCKNYVESSGLERAELKDEVLSLEFTLREELDTQMSEWDWDWNGELKS